MSPPVAQVSTRAPAVHGHLLLIGDQAGDLHPEAGNDPRNGPSHCRAASPAETRFPSFVAFHALRLRHFASRLLNPCPELAHDRGFARGAPC
jgi:hypothetical protein